MSDIAKIRPSINLSSTIKDIMKIDTQYEFCELLSDLTANLCLKNFWHMIAPNKFDTKESTLTAVNDFPKEFEENYLRGNKAAFNCPVLHYAYQYSQQPILWSEMIDYASLSDEQNQLMEWYSTFGINTGICFPIHEPGNRYAVLTFLLDEEKNISITEITQIKEY